MICEGQNLILPHKVGTRMQKKNEATHVSSKSFSSIADPIRRSNFAFSSLKTQRVISNISVCCTNLLRRTCLFSAIDYLNNHRLQKQTCHVVRNAHNTMCILSNIIARFLAGLLPRDSEFPGINKIKKKFQTHFSHLERNIL